MTDTKFYDKFQTKYIMQAWVVDPSKVGKLIDLLNATGLDWKYEDFFLTANSTTVVNDDLLANYKTDKLKEEFMGYLFDSLSNKLGSEIWKAGLARITETK